MKPSSVNRDFLLPRDSGFTVVENSAQSGVALQPMRQAVK
jgi:hypothetical protein